MRRASSACLNDCNDPALKDARLATLRHLRGFVFERVDIADTDTMRDLFARGGLTLVGFLHVLEGGSARQVEHLVYASSSSVYGGNTQLPFAEDGAVDHPVSLHATTTKADELMAHACSTFAATHRYR